jgi:hypothetical protein
MKVLIGNVLRDTTTTAEPKIKNHKRPLIYNTHYRWI